VIKEEFLFPEATEEENSYSCRDAKNFDEAAKNSLRSRFYIAPKRTPTPSHGLPSPEPQKPLLTPVQEGMFDVNLTLK